MALTTKNRFGSVGPSSNLIVDEPPRMHGASFGAGLGNGVNGWKNGGIWANTIGSGMRTASIERGRRPVAHGNFPSDAEIMTGSGSLLPSSESDSWDDRQSTPWRSMENASPTRSSSHAHHATSPTRRKSSSKLIALPLAESSAANTSYFSLPQGASEGHVMLSKSGRKSLFNPTSGNFAASTGLDPTYPGRPSRPHGSDDENRYSPPGLGMGGDVAWKEPVGRPAFQPSYSDRTYIPTSRNGSLPEISLHKSDERAHTQFSHLGPPAPPHAHRQNLSARSSFSTQPGSYGKLVGGRSSSPHLSALAMDFDQMAIGRRTSDPYLVESREEPMMNLNGGFQHEYAHPMGQPESSNPWLFDEIGFQNNPEPLMPPQGIPTDRAFPIYSDPNRGVPPFNATPYSQPMESGDHHLVPNAHLYSSSNIPPGIPPTIQQRMPRGHHQPLGTPDGLNPALDRRPRGSYPVQQDHPGYPSAPNPLNFRAPFGPYDFHPHGPPHGALQMNPLAPYYHMSPGSNGLATPSIPRGPAREHDVGQHIRSPLLEEFRNNSKTNKRYELKDIFNHIVEFSGDQHGSRFIQTRLETANSDEKDQVFREIHPNSLQLMTDVFGNYVIQKFFEHGNQAQKKMLAHQMKNHILTLSLQMYGCRVVQKALEHILTDQQAQLIRELEQHVLKCVKDQNGNHVIQKAIERVPAIHIEFIIKAFTGQVHGLATHPYGCRVIQRMLEHCEEPTRSAVLHELHACAAALIIDQYGNYVTQHVIEHGREQDRTKIISLITGNLANLSKHKFASNVVEKSIQFGTADQRRQMIDILTVLNEKGESALQALIRDQFGNYVIQKLLAQLKDAEFDRFIELVKPQLALLKRYSYGKQIAAIEKMVYQPTTPPTLMPRHLSIPTPIDTSAAPTPPLLPGDGQSPQSSSHPSTNASSVNGAADSCSKAENGNAVDVFSPSST